MKRKLNVAHIGTEEQGIKRRNPLVILLSAFLLLTLLLGACGDSGSEPVVNVTPASQEQDEDVTTETLEGAEIESDVDDVGDADEVTVITDTVLITGTEVITDVTVTTDTVVVEEKLVTTVVTDTELVTDVAESSDTSTTTESEVTTNTEELAPDTTTSEAEADVVVAFIGIDGSIGRSIRASTLLDADFKTSDGDVGGEIEDLVIDIQNGQVLYVLLEYGGILDIGDTDMPVPLSAFSWGSEDELILNIEGERLENFPGVSNDWPVSDDNAWDMDVRNFWEGSDVDTGYNAEQSMQGVRRASNLIGGPISNGELGDRFVQDMIISLGEGQVSYVLVSGSDAGAGDEWFVVPFSAFDATAPQDGLTLNSDFDSALLDQAPRFDMTTMGQSRVFDEGYDDDWQGFWGDAGYPVRAGNE